MSALVFVKDLLVATFGQMASLFAGVLVFGLLVQFFSQLTFKSLENAFGRKGVYFVAWLGTPIHELGHALFCLIFLHRIVEIELFRPDPVSGTLGYVSHTWNRKNPWHVLGNFFIGVGPVLMGCGALLGIFLLLVPQSPEVWEAIRSGVGRAGDLTAWEAYLEILKSSSLTMAKYIFTISNLGTWRFWVFLYLSICVASNVRLSTSDLKLALSGLGCVVLPFLLINLVALLTGAGGEQLFPFTASSLGVVYSLFVLALIMAVIGFVIIYPLSAAWVRLRHRQILRPF